MPVEFEQPKLSDVAPNINQKTSELKSKKAWGKLWLIIFLPVFM
jgi:hypothetical protein